MPKQLTQHQGISKAQEWLAVWREARSPDLSQIEVQFVLNQANQICIQLGESDFFIHLIGNDKSTGNIGVEILAKQCNITPLIEEIIQNRVASADAFLTLPWKTLSLQTDKMNFVMRLLMQTHITAAKRCNDRTALIDCKGVAGRKAYAEMEEADIASVMATPKRSSMRSTSRI